MKICDWSIVTRLGTTVVCAALAAGARAAPVLAPGFTIQSPFTQSTWGTGFSTIPANDPNTGVGPIGILVLPNKTVLVTEANGDLRRFPYDTPLIPGGSQPTLNYSAGTIIASFGLSNAVGLGMLVGSPTKYFMTQDVSNRVVEINPSTGATIGPFTPVPRPLAICGFPSNGHFIGDTAYVGHLLVSSENGGIWIVDPIAHTASQFLPGVFADGIAMTPSGRYLVAATFPQGGGPAGEFTVIDLSPTPTVVYSVPVPYCDGIALGQGLALGGKAYINTNDGKIWEVVYDTNPSNALEFEPPTSPIVNTIASGGSRGDFIAVDVREPCVSSGAGVGAVRYPSLLVTQSDSIIRIDPPNAGWFGPPYNVEAVIHVDQSFCAGDGSLPTNCPCSNFGLPGHGCENSHSTGGALLSVTGSTIPDTMVLQSIGQLPTAASLVFQGTVNTASGAVFGDGLRCVGGAVRRIAVKNAVNGVVLYPDLAELSITGRSALLGDPIAQGASRYYQVYYRDPVAGFCGSTTSTFNVSNAIRIDW